MREMYQTDLFSTVVCMTGPYEDTVKGAGTIFATLLCTRNEVKALSGDLAVQLYAVTRLALLTINIGDYLHYIAKLVLAKHNYK